MGRRAITILLFSVAAVSCDSEGGGGDESCRTNAECGEGWVCARTMCYPICTENCEAECLRDELSGNAYCDYRLGDAGPSDPLNNRAEQDAGPTSDVASDADAMD